MNIYNLYLKPSLLTKHSYHIILSKSNPFDSACNTAQEQQTFQTNINK